MGRIKFICYNSTFNVSVHRLHLLRCHARGMVNLPPRPTEESSHIRSQQTTGGLAVLHLYATSCRVSCLCSDNRVCRDCACVVCCCCIYLCACVRVCLLQCRYQISCVLNLYLYIYIYNLSMRLSVCLSVR